MIKRNTPFKSKPQYNALYKGKIVISSCKRGYKTSNMNRSKTRYYNCNKLGHFTTECKKKKQVKKDKYYLDLEAKHEALLKK